MATIPLKEAGPFGQEALMVSPTTAEIDAAEGYNGEGCTVVLDEGFFREHTGASTISSIWYVAELGVHPEYRRKGIASHLLQIAKTSASSSSSSCGLWGVPDTVECIVLRASLSKKNAIWLYEKAGFKVLPSVKQERHYSNARHTASLVVTKIFMFNALLR